MLRLGRGAIIELDASEDDEVHILANNLPVARGNVVVNGNRIDQLTEAEMMPVRNDLGMIFQEGALFDSLTVRENVGYKLFDCGGVGSTGFLVRLNALFTYTGDPSVGTWTIVDAWGALAGMTGSGKLTGIPIDGENGIIDNYIGTVTL